MVKERSMLRDEEEEEEGEEEAYFASMRRREEPESEAKREHERINAQRREICNLRDTSRPKIPSMQQPLRQPQRGGIRTQPLPQDRANDAEHRQMAGWDAWNSERLHHAQRNANGNRSGNATNNAYEETNENCAIFANHANVTYLDASSTGRAVGANNVEVDTRCRFSMSKNIS